MSKTTTFGALVKGDHIVMAGAEFVVDKAKLKGKVVKLTVTGKRGTFSSEVKAKGTVELAPKSTKPGKVALDGPKGEQQRWATKKEARKAEDWVRDRPTSLPAGDPAVTKRPAKAEGGPWETKHDRIEEDLERFLSAHLVGEATDEGVGYYVPPVDVETIAAHLLIFHGVDGTAYASAADALTLHEQHHADAKTGGAMHVNHWHTKQRP